jgi:hypothetical protein
MGRLLGLVLLVLFTASFSSAGMPYASADSFTLTIAEDKGQGYNRSLFRHWIDADRDGCNTRNEVLIEEAVKKQKIGKRCQLTNGSWVSPYDGKRYSNPSKLDIDHLVPLSEAWRSGASQWTNAQRERFANDLESPEALVAVTLNLNRSKGDRDVTDWLPPSDKCSYISSWVKIKVKYSLTVDLRESKALLKESEACSLSLEFIESEENSVSDPIPSVSTTPTTPTPEPTKSSGSSSSSLLPLVSPGAFCSQTQAGQQGQNSKGVIYACKTSDTESRLRWRQ